MVKSKAVICDGKGAVQAPHPPNIHYWKCNFPLNSYIRLLVGPSVSWLVGFFQFPKKAGKLHFHVLSDRLFHRRGSRLRIRGWRHKRMHQRHQRHHRYHNLCWLPARNDQQVPGRGGGGGGGFQETLAHAGESSGTFFYFLFKKFSGAFFFVHF